MGTIVNNSALYIWKWLREQILKVLLTRKKKNSLQLCMVTDTNKTLRWSFHNIYKYWIIRLYTWNKNNVIRHYTSIKNKFIWWIKNKNFLSFLFTFLYGTLVAQMVKNLPAIQETQLCSLGRVNPLEKGGLPIPVFLPGEFHGQMSLVGYSPCSHKESTDTTEAVEHTYLGLLLCQR